MWDDYNSGAYVDFNRFMRVAEAMLDFEDFVSGLAVKITDTVRMILRQRPVRPARVSILFQPRWHSSRWKSTT